MRKLALMMRSVLSSGLRIAAAYLWLFRARRLMKRARGSEWVVGEQGRSRSSTTGPEVTREAWALIKNRVAAISRASRYPVPWAFCLQRSLALREWLAKDGIFAEVRYGVRRRDGKFDAHAWVVYDGKIINDSVRHVSTFAPLRSLDEYGGASRKEIRRALVASKAENETGSTEKSI